MACSPAWQLAVSVKVPGGWLTSIVRTWMVLNPCNCPASIPSSLSALRLATIVPESTFMGALPDSTRRSRAVAAELVELLSMSRLGPATLPTSLLTAFTVLVFPRSKRDPTPVPANAVETTPTVRARMNAKPTKNTVAFPTHITFEATLLIICPSHSFLALSLLLATQPTRWGRVAIPGLEGGQVAVLRSHVASAGHVMNAAYSCLRRVYVRQGTKHVRPQVSAELRRTPCMRTSQNPQKAKFAEFFF